MDFQINYPRTKMSIARLQSGLSFLIKYAEEHSKNWRDFAFSEDGNSYFVLSKGGEFYATVDVQKNTCTCIAEDSCWHKSLIACILENEFPEFDAEISTIVTGFAKEPVLYELYVKIDGQEFIVRPGIQKPLSFWEGIVRKTFNKSVLLFKPDTNESRRYLGKVK
jgi:hypothetical protein